MFASRSLVLLAALLTTLPVQAQIYKYYDQNGNLVLTDEAREGAVKVETGPVMTVPALKGRAPDPAAAQPAAPAAPCPSTWCCSTVRRPRPPIVVAASRCPSGSPSRPACSRAIASRCCSTGAVQPDNITELKIDETVDRGAHTLSARVVDADGKVIATSPGVTIHVQQASRIKPK